MRTSVLDELHALRRPAALAALVAAAGGAIAAMAPRLPLWRLDARVQALDTIDTAAVASLPGAETTPVVWLATAAGALVLAVAVLVAVDRPPAHAERLLLLGAATIVIVALVGRLSPPGTVAFASHPHAAELLQSPVTLPTGVGIELLVHPAAGLWTLLGAAAAIIAGTLVARRG